MNYTLSSIVSTLYKKGFKVYTSPNRLNIVGIRTSNDISETFDDFIVFFYYDDNGFLRGKICPATTDPSVQYLQKPMNANGTAILKSGQYLDAYQLGMHKGKYKALVQRKPVTVIRDKDRDSLLNFFSETQTGLFGINIHRASRGKNNVSVIGLDSAGCQVFMNENDFNQMMELADISAALYGNSFTYTLLDEKDITKQTRNYLLVGVGIIMISIFGYLYFKNR